MTDTFGPTDIRQQMKRKLASSILRRLEGARAIEEHPHVIWFDRYARFHEAALALAAAGVSNPIIAFVTGSNGASGTASWISTAPTWLGMIGAIALVFWIPLRVYVNTERLAERVPLYRACKRELGALEAQLDDTLAGADPTNPGKAIAELQNAASEIVARYYSAGNWPWEIGPEDRADRIQKRAQELVALHGDEWVSPPNLSGQKEAA